ncbi:arsenate reductase (glutaredoxin) [Noviherbaspirillum massiliense]|uniref:arsenate reductase (glutaredoxin) n=1 Tax=Noviherbaspirillum massiliense TaxID=1465823 RepID=UPI00031A3F02|nr:arsenate reductase (glutaredoxin) [Noviherbaspirillum massiliense]
MITIYHNPRCSKSRAALELVQQVSQERGLPLTVVDYLKTPLTAAQLTALHRQLRTPARDMVRENEEEYAALSLDEADDEALMQAIAQHPRLLQRPIVVYQARAMVGRPPEKLHALFEAS